MARDGKMREPGWVWLNVGGGLLAAGHRPGAKLLPALERGACTHVVTILSEKEGALDFRAACLQHHLGWIWIPLGSARPPEKRQTRGIRETFVRMRELLLSSAGLYVYCSGGIHRTGMIVHGFLRSWNGETSSLSLGWIAPRPVVPPSPGEPFRLTLVQEVTQ